MSAPAPNNNDAAIWLSLGLQLKKQLNLTGDNQLWLAPMSSAGIAAGFGVPTELLNQGVESVGDALLHPSNPIFTPNQDSYFTRVLRYINNVELGGDASAGAKKAYEMAREKLNEASDAMKDARDAALDEYDDWKTTGGVGTFFEWIAAGNFPLYLTAEAAVTAAAANVYAALSVISGKDGEVLAQAIQHLQAASNATAPAVSYNMPCCSLQATDISNKKYPSPLPVSYLPAYAIASSYQSDVDGWIQNFSKDVDNPRYTFKINIKDAASSNWSQLGFEESDVNVEGSYCIFFRASYKDHRKTVTEEVHASSSADEIDITITATGFGSYPITPGNWDVKALRDFTLKKDASPELNKPASKVAYAVLAYGIGMTISLSGETQSKVSGAVEKAAKAGGKVSFFGFEIGGSGGRDYQSSSTTSWSDFKSHENCSKIEIKPQNNGYPTLLGVIGTPIFPAQASD